MVANSGGVPLAPKPPGRPVKTCDLQQPLPPPSEKQVGVGGVELTVRELEAMAMRQEEEMAAGRQLLAVKESRLRHLKETEARHAAVAHEQDRLRRLRDRVEAQEQKLNKLRALRGQLDHNKASNHNLTSDLDSIRALFNEKEKELTLAVAKVDELTRQLEDVRRGRQSQPPTTTASQELERLRRELMYRNKVNEQQSQRLSEEREMLCQRQVEMASIDKRIAELQERLHRKRMLNQQLANQISAASNKASVNQNNNRGQLGTLTQQNLYQLSGGGTKQMLRSIPLGNIAAVEPYHHVPTYSTRDQEQADFIKQQQHQQHQESLKNDHLRFSGGCVPSQEDVMGPRKQNMTAPAVHHYIQETKSQREDKQQVILSPDNNNADLTAFGPSKSDPKYQTLPYNTKFTGSSQTGKHQGKRASAEGNEHYSDNVESKNHNNNSSSNNLNHINNNNLNQQQQQHVVHSIPIMAGANKGLAMALSNKMPSASSPTSSTSSYSSVAHLGPRVYSSNVLTSSLMARGQPVGGASSTTSSTSSLATSSSAGSSQLPTSRLALPPTPLISDVQVSPLVSNHQKPVNTVSPSPLQQTANIYQTSSAKIHAVQPQSVTTQPPQVQIKEETETSKPALPPKPAAPVKPTPPPPPRQSHNSVEVTASAELPSGLTVIYSEEPPPLPSEPPPDDPTIPKRGGSELLIKARPLTIKKQLPPSDLPRLKTLSLEDRGKTDDEVGLSERSRMLSSDDSDDTTTTTHSNGGGLLRNRRIEMPPEFLFPENEAPPADLVSSTSSSSPGEDQTDRSVVAEDSDVSDTVAQDTVVVTRRAKKGNLKGSGDKQTLSRRVSFDPLALLLDASLEGELELVMRTAGQVRDPSAANDEGITALHNAICAGHFDIVTFLVKFGCDVNAQDSDGWTPLHCAASCNNVAMVRFLVEHGACIFATTLSDHETAAEKCEEDEEGFDGCSEYLYSVQEKLGIMNNGVVYAVFDYEAHNPDELSFHERDKLIVLRKGDEWEREWWWARHDDKEGYIPRNLLGLYPRVHPNNKNSD